MTAGKPEIRPALIEDIPGVFRLGERCYDVLDKPYNWWSVEEVTQHISSWPEVCFVAEAEGRVVGFALGSTDFELIEDTGHLEWIAVDVDYRRHGLASRLIEAAVAAYRRLGRVWVVSDISSKNEASQGMARRNGFTEGISVTFWMKEVRPD